MEEVSPNSSFLFLLVFPSIFPSFSKVIVSVLFTFLLILLSAHSIVSWPFVLVLFFLFDTSVYPLLSLLIVFAVIVLLFAATTRCASAAFVHNQKLDPPRAAVSLTGCMDWRPRIRNEGPNEHRQILRLMATLKQGRVHGFFFRSWFVRGARGKVGTVLTDGETHRSTEWVVFGPQCFL